jgi:glutathione S-transferase
MHSSFAALRREHGMNVRRRFPFQGMTPETTADVVRIMGLWAEARARYGKGGPYLFGTFGAADIMFAPVVTRLVTYSIPIPRFAEAYIEAILTHPWMQDWLAAAQDEPWVIEKFEQPVGA